MQKSLDKINLDKENLNIKIAKTTLNSSKMKFSRDLSKKTGIHSIFLDLEVLKQKL